MIVSMRDGTGEMSREAAKAPPSGASVVVEGKELVFSPGRAARLDSEKFAPRAGCVTDAVTAQMAAKATDQAALTLRHFRSRQSWRYSEQAAYVPRITSKRGDEMRRHGNRQLDGALARVHPDRFRAASSHGVAI
ncbi:hypothetical protein [Paraburkholderia diazotrophica]|uniref:hypothetical protein n=1 Tax=Paraburkholderia diazotrophica TaxID=667676 RepID=UPI00115FC0D2|nr:hypothetical protein [Paraburkholderia diazotrophica]